MVQKSTAGLKRNIEKDDNKIIVTTIQSWITLMKSEIDLAIYQNKVVFHFLTNVTVLSLVKHKEPEQEV